MNTDAEEREILRKEAFAAMRKNGDGARMKIDAEFIVDLVNDVDDLERFINRMPGLPK